jgi:hypothetical protein
MALATNIVSRGRVYYVRVAVPKDLQARIGKAEVWRSLRTKDQRDARRLAPAVLADLHAEWEDMRRRRSPASVDVHRIARTFYDRELDLDRQRRARLPEADELEVEQARLLDPGHLARLSAELGSRNGKDLGLAVMDASLEFAVMRDAANMDEANRKVLLATLRDHLRRGETVLVRSAADEAIDREGLQVDKGTPAYRELCQALQRAWIQALERTVERDQGKWDGRPTDEVVSIPPGAPEPTKAPPGESVMDLFDAYADENPKNVKADTLLQNRKIIALFAQCVGSAFPATAIDKSVVREWKMLLRKFLIRAAEIREFKKLSFREVVRRNEQLKRPTLTAKTVNKYLSGLGAFCH